MMFEAMWHILLALAPWLLLGAIVGGALHALLPAGFTKRHLDGPWGVLKAVGIGVPLPLCSCGVIPAGLSLKKDGASDGAAVGFLISTPQTGVDSILVSGSFLGWPFAALKVVAASVTGILGGWLIDAVGDESSAEPEDAPDVIPQNSSGRERLRLALVFGLDLIRTIWRWLVLGIVLSALIEVYVPTAVFARVGAWGDVWAAVAALLLSAPLYVCATSSVPIAAALVAGGLPLGAALVFLMAGPATNVATVGAVYRGFGKRVLAMYLAAIIVGSMGFGLAFDWVLADSVMGPATMHTHTGLGTIVAGVILLGLFAFFVGEEVLRFIRLRAGVSGLTTELAVDGMHCQNCVKKLETVLAKEAGVTKVVVTLNPGAARVYGSVAEHRVREVIDEAGFRCGESTEARGEVG